MTQLAVVGTEPADLAEGVPADLHEFVVVFNEPIDAASLTPTSVRATCPLGDLPGTLMVGPGGTTVHLIFTQPLGFLMPVDVTVDATARSVAGSVLGSDFESEFTTVPESMVVTPAEFYGEVGDTTVVSCLLVGDLGTEPATGMVFTTDDPSIATVNPDGTITLQDFGQTIITVDDGTTQTPIPVAAAEFLGRGSALMATAAQWEVMTEGDPFWKLHTWDVSNEGNVDDGGHDQFDTIWDITISHPTTGLSESFPGVDLPDVRFDAPYAFHDSIALETEAHWDGTQHSGTGAGQLRPIGQACLWQEVDLPADATSLEFAWWMYGDLAEVFVEEIGIRVTVIDLTGGAPEATIYEHLTHAGQHVDWREYSADLLDWAGQTVRLKFEIWGGEREDRGGGYFIDDAYLIDQDETDYLVNGDFENGLTGWVGGTYLIPREVNLEPTTPVADVIVKRSIYAPYTDGYWIRYLDSFHNPGEVELHITVRFDGDLGSDGMGVVYMAHSDRAVLEFDSSVGGDDPALGTLPGTFSTKSAPVYDGDWTFTYNVMIPPGGTVSLLAFHLFGDNNVPQPNVFLEALAGDILSSVDAVGVASPYLRGVSPTEFASVVNWP